MSTPLQNLNNDELFFILECRNLKEINAKFDKEQYQAFLDYVNKLLDMEIKKHSIHSSIAAINAVDYPLQLFWAIMSLSSGLAVLPLAVPAFAILIGIGAAQYYHSQGKSKKKTAKLLQEFQLGILKLCATHVLIERQINEFDVALQKNHEFKKFLNDANLTFVEHKPKKENEIINLTNLQIAKPHKLPSIMVSVAITTTLFSSYFWGVSSIIETLGYVAVSSAMTGPIGLAIAGAIVIAIGIYFGYKHYQARKNEKLLRAMQNTINEQVATSTKECIELKEKHEIIQTINHISDVMPVPDARPVDVLPPVIQPIIKPPLPPVEENLLDLSPREDVKSPEHADAYAEDEKLEDEQRQALLAKEKEPSPIVIEPAKEEPAKLVRKKLIAPLLGAQLFFAKRWNNAHRLAQKAIEPQVPANLSLALS